MSLFTYRMCTQMYMHSFIFFKKNAYGVHIFVILTDGKH